MVDVEAGFQVRAAGTEAETVDTRELPWLTAEVRDLSPEGACISTNKKLDLRRRDWLAIRMKLSRGVVVIPARVMWIQTEDLTTTIGLELHLELAPHAMRTRYASWIVNELQAAGD